MCSQDDFPPYDDPEPYDPPVTRPRKYVLSGTLPTSAALAVIGEMLTEAESDLYDGITSEGDRFVIGLRIAALHEARERIAAAER